MGQIGKLLEASITGVDMPAKPAPMMDLSEIGFEALRSRFKESKHQNACLEGRHPRPVGRVDSPQQNVR